MKLFVIFDKNNKQYFTENYKSWSFSEDKAKLYFNLAKARQVRSGLSRKNEDRQLVIKILVTKEEKEV